MTPHSRSPFLLLPVEVRLNIYRHLSDCIDLHITSHGDHLRMTACTQPLCEQDPWQTGLERYEALDPPLLQALIAGHNPTSGGVVESTSLAGYEEWVRRLSSSWGSHWQCEEIALGAKGKHRIQHPFSALLHVCRVIHDEIIETLARRAVVNVTDLQTLARMAEICSELLHRKAPLYTPVSNLLPTLRKICITLVFPFKVLREMANSPEWRAWRDANNSRDGAGHYQGSSYLHTDGWRVWEQLDAVITSFPELRSLELWLDHGDADYSWIDARERHLIHYLFPLAAIPKLQVSLHLPKISPFFARPDYHFIEGGAPSPFKIRRRLRQIFLVGVFTSDWGGSCSISPLVIFRPEFPLLVHQIEFQDWPKDVVEEMERRELKNGFYTHLRELPREASVAYYLGRLRQISREVEAASSADVARDGNVKEVQ
ncbi:uncharacterized protein EI97DRAFT_502969 [Westerdykella ornata]|uniref:Uncharacterized protein n=1 Tax=Westerdykella ornata TaxID=318751 RepID=A0A6A6JCT7_WESOR|nr:uncharacterized protein EI97DRAFT_502969 [Westerdykella ornata]KAF2274085.1 hypothetical protein EI97DRAFT_502969 [Westerdykella ornata]